MILFDIRRIIGTYLTPNQLQSFVTSWGNLEYNASYWTHNATEFDTIFKSVTLTGLKCNMNCHHQLDYHKLHHIVLNDNIPIKRIHKCINITHLTLTRHRKFLGDKSIYSNFKKLQSLNICVAFNWFSNTHILNIFPNLSTFKIVKCDDLIDISGLPFCPNLSTLELSYCSNIRHNYVEILRECPNLKKLTFRLWYNERIVQPAISKLLTLKHLTVEGITHTPHTMPKLKTMIIKSSVPSTFQPASMPKCKKIILNDCPNPDISSLSKFPQLTHLEIRQSSVKQFESLSNCPNLRTLIIADCIPTDLAQKKFPKLTTYEQYYQDNLIALCISGRSNVDIIYPFKKLQFLDIPSCTIKNIQSLERFTYDSRTTIHIRSSNDVTLNLPNSTIESWPEHYVRVNPLVSIQNNHHSLLITCYDKILNSSTFHHPNLQNIELAF